jgi:hypothetical protein
MPFELPIFPNAPGKLVGYSGLNFSQLVGVDSDVNPLKVIEVRLKHSLKIAPCIVFTELGIVTSVNSSQAAKASPAIEVTESGIVILVRAEPVKALHPIEVTEFQMMLFN